MRKRLVIIGLFLISSDAGAQIRPLNLNYIERIQDSRYYFAYSNKVAPDDSGEIRQLHSAIQPAYVGDYGIGFRSGVLSAKFGKDYYDDGPFPLGGKSYDRKAWRFYPLIEAAGGLQSGNNARGVYTLGIGPGLEYSGKKMFFTTKILPYINQAPFVADSLQKNLNIDAGSNRSPGNGIFYRTEIVGAYQPSRFFLFSGGIGKNFFGDGYRSMLLSDNAGSNPFVKIETNFGPVQYVNLIQQWSDNTTNPFDRTKDGYKYSATHYISWNVTRNFNVGIFESVVWRSRDSSTFRGFDPTYINPIVFYRSVEYGAGSADNVLLGLNSSVKIDEKNNFYFQLLLDEFLLSEIKSDSNWWGNKYGVQLGYKSNRFFTDHLYFQLEYNMARPFTYSHKNPLEAYGNMNASAAHPLGANFYEVLNIISWGRELRITNKMVWNSFGRDTSGVSYGQNPFVSYQLRDGNYGHKITQGLRTNVFNESVIVEFPALAGNYLFFNITYNYRMEWNKYGITNNHCFLAGVRLRLWNSYTDY